MASMNTRIDLEKVDYSQGRDLLAEFMSGDRQCIPTQWNQFFDISLTPGYQQNTQREFDFAKLKDLSQNDIQVIIVPPASLPVTLPNDESHPDQ